MSLRKNILAGYAGQAYVTLIGVLMVPLYIRHMGAEAYGLVGFFAMLQAWFNLLDAGLSPTLAREASRFRGGALDASAFRRLVRTLEAIFLVVAAVGGTALFAASDVISVRWLRASELDPGELRVSLQLMALIVAMRWLSGLYRGIVSGSERLVWLNGFNAAIATLRFVGVLPFILLVSAAPSRFFGYQLGIAALELVGLFLYAHRLLPVVPSGTSAPDWKSLGRLLRFSGAIAATSSVWILVTQTDKLVLSKTLPLAEYGYFTLAVLVAGGVMVIGAPVGAALMPRMSRMEAEGDHAGLIRAYRRATQWVAVFSGAASLTVALCAEPLLGAWTGDRDLARQAAPILVLYALGNGILTVAAFPYYLQYAKGDLRLHLLGNLLFVVVLVPAIVWAAGRYGGIGAGWVWLGTNALSFVAWLPLVHRKFERGLNLKWYGQDTTAIFAASAVVGYCVVWLLPEAAERWSQAAEVLIVGLAVLAAGAAASSEARRSFTRRLAGPQGGKA